MAEQLDACIGIPPIPDTRRVHRGSRWVDSRACSALCQLILDDRRCCSGAEPSRPRRKPLPPSLYAQNVAPFLRFDAPLPNMLYAFGGRNQSQGPLDAVEMFDTWWGRWVFCPPMPTRRAGSAAAMLPDLRIMVIGGYNDRGIAEGLLACCDTYDPWTLEWVKGGAAPLARARWGHGCAALGGQVFVVGGCSLQPDQQPREAFMETLKSCEVYNPEENLWRPCAPLQIPRSGSRVVALGERYLAAIGGCDDVFGRAETQPTVELYDVTCGSWALLETRLLYPRTTAAVAAIDDRQLLVAGGAPSLSSAEVYKMSLPGDDGPQHATMNGEAAEGELEEMIDGRMGCQAAVINLPRDDKTYPITSAPCAVIVGGERCDEGGLAGDWPRIRQFSSVSAYDVEKRAWRKPSTVPDMASPRTAVALCVAFGHVS